MQHGDTNLVVAICDDARYHHGVLLVPADPALSCSGAADNSVWFTYTASKTVTLLFDTNGSDHSTAIAVFTDGWTAATEIACAQDQDSDNRT